MNLVYMQFFIMDFCVYIYIPFFVYFVILCIYRDPMTFQFKLYEVMS